MMKVIYPSADVNTSWGRAEEGLLGSMLISDRLSQDTNQQVSVIMQTLIIDFILVCF